MENKSNIIESDKVFYVYVYLDPRKPGKYVYGPYEFDHEPFYVGKGHGDRFKVHLLKSSLKNDKNKLKINKINKILEKLKEIPIILKIRENLSEKESYELELDIISNIGRINIKTGPLTNLSNGGKGSSKGAKWNEEQRKNFSKSRKGLISGEKHPLFGKPWTEKQRAAHAKLFNGITNPMYGKRGNLHWAFQKPLSEECKEKISISRIKFLKNNPEQSKKEIERLVKFRFKSKYRWFIINDNNEKIEINIRDFCKENGIDYKNVVSSFRKGRTIVKFKNKWIFTREIITPS